MIDKDLEEATKCFGRLLALMSDKELRDYSARAAAIAFDPPPSWAVTTGSIEYRNDMRVLHQILESEISERRIEF
jgi:hypothetical protein